MTLIPVEEHEDMNKAARTWAAGIAVAAVALTGCTQPPGAAATVDGVRIPDSTVTRAGEALVTLGGAAPSIAYKQAAYDLTLGEASRQIAASVGESVSDADRSAILGRNPGAARVAATPEGQAWGEAVSTTYLVLEKVGEEQFSQKLRDLDIDVNPRYGTWSAEQFTMVDSALSRPAATGARP